MSIAIRQSILHGNIQNATRQVSAFFCSEEQQQDYSLLIPRQLLFPLKCQEWIELIRSNIDLEQRVEFITNELCKIKQQQPDTEEWSYLEVSRCDGGGAVLSMIDSIRLVLLLPCMTISMITTKSPNFLGLGYWTRARENELRTLSMRISCYLA